MGFVSYSGFYYHGLYCILPYCTLLQPIVICCIALVCFVLFLIVICCNVLCNIQAPPRHVFKSGARAKLLTAVSMPIKQVFYKWRSSGWYRSLSRVRAEAWKPPAIQYFMIAFLANLASKARSLDVYVKLKGGGTKPLTEASPHRRHVFYKWGYGGRYRLFNGSKIQSCGL